MVFHLVHLTGDRAGRSAEFEQSRVTIGRAAKCDVGFDPYLDTAVASLHAEIILDEDAYFVFDAETRNGTFVNGTRIDAATKLQHEDYLQFGREGPELIFRLGPAGPDPQPLPAAPPLMAELEMVTGTDTGKVFPVFGTRVTRVGRRGDLEVALDPRGDMVVSGHHCSLTPDDTRFVLTDTSRNGTFVNGEPVRRMMEVLDGDVITFGEGGPRARFRIHPPRRVYPNRQGQRGRARVGSQLSRPPQQASAAPETRVAAEGSSPTRRAVAQLKPVAEPSRDDSAAYDGDSSVGDTLNSLAASSQRKPITAEDFSLENWNSGSSPASDVVDWSEGDSAVSFSGREDSVSELQIPARKEAQPWKPRRGDADGDSVDSGDDARRKPAMSRVLMAAGAVLGVVILIGVGLAYAFAKSRSGPASGAVDVNTYVDAISAGSITANADGRFSVKVPNKWAVRQDVAQLSTESDDKLMVAHYLRDAALSPEAVLKHLKEMGRPASQVAKETRGDVSVTYFAARDADRSRIAMLKVPKDSVPLLAMVEGPESLLSALPKDSLRALLEGGVTMQPLPMAAPTAGAGTTGNPPPGDATLDLSRPSATSTPAAAATPTPEPTPLPEPVTTPAPTPTPAPESRSVENRKLGLKLPLPAGWNGTSDEDQGVLGVLTARGMDIRITREPKAVEAEGMFGALVADGYQTLNVLRNRTIEKRSVSVALMRKQEERVMLAVMDQADGSTILIYGTLDRSADNQITAEFEKVLNEIAKQSPTP